MPERYVENDDILGSVADEIASREKIINAVLKIK